MNRPKVQIITTEITEPGGNPPYAIVPINSRRGYVIINPLSVTGLAYLCTGSNGSAGTIFDQLLANQQLIYLRYEFGALVTSETYFTDASGHTPTCHLIVTEGILL